VEPLQPVRQRLLAEGRGEEIHNRLLVCARPFAELDEFGLPERGQQVPDELHLLAGQYELTTIRRVVDAVEGRAAGGALVLDVGLGAVGERCGWRGGGARPT